MLLRRTLMLSVQLFVACCMTVSVFGADFAAAGPGSVLVIGVAGGTGSGKTTFAEQLVGQIRDAGVDVAYLSHDFYYKVLSHLPMSERNATNFDHPEALDSALLREHLLALKNHEQIHVPKYDFSTHNRVEGEETTISPARVVVVDGILLFAAEEIKDLFDIKFFIDTEESVRYSRRETRDIAERGRTEESVRAQIAATVKPMHDLFVEPCKHSVDVVFSGEADNSMYIQFLSGDIAEAFSAGHFHDTSKFAELITTIVTNIKDLQFI